MPEIANTRHLIAQLVRRYHDPLRESLPQLQLAVAHAAHAPGPHREALQEIESLSDHVIDLSLAHADEQERIVFPVLLGKRTPPRDFAGALARSREQGRALVDLVGRLQSAVERGGRNGPLPTVLAARFEALATDLYDQVALELGGLLSPTT